MSLVLREINEENYPTAIAAIRDILYMYYELAQEKYFFHSVDTGTFDPLFFADCWFCEPPGGGCSIDVDLLHKGSAVAILCQLSDIWDESCEIPETEFAFQVKHALEEDRFDHLPLAEHTIRLAFQNEEQFRESLTEVYKTHVLEFFKKIAEN